MVAVVVGIDPGLVNLGLCAICVDTGEPVVWKCINITAKTPTLRCQNLMDQLDSTCLTTDYDVQAVYIESQQDSVMMCISWGIMMYFLNHHAPGVTIVNGITKDNLIGKCASYYERKRRAVEWVTKNAPCPIPVANKADDLADAFLYAYMARQKVKNFVGCAI